MLFTHDISQAQFCCSNYPSGRGLSTLRGQGGARQTLSLGWSSQWLSNAGRQQEQHDQRVTSVEVCPDIPGPATRGEDA